MHHPLCCCRFLLLISFFVLFFLGSSFLCHCLVILHSLLHSSHSIQFKWNKIWPNQDWECAWRERAGRWAAMKGQQQQQQISNQSIRSHLVVKLAAVVVVIQLKWYFSLCVLLASRDSSSSYMKWYSWKCIYSIHPFHFTSFPFTVFLSFANKYFPLFSCQWSGVKWHRQNRDRIENKTKAQDKRIFSYYLFNYRMAWCYGIFYSAQSDLSFGCVLGRDPIRNESTKIKWNKLLFGISALQCNGYFPLLPPSLLLPLPRLMFLLSEILLNLVSSRFATLIPIRAQNEIWI